MACFQILWYGLSTFAVVAMLCEWAGYRRKFTDNCRGHLILESLLAKTMPDANVAQLVSEASTHARHACRQAPIEADKCYCLRCRLSSIGAMSRSIRTQHQIMRDVPVLVYRCGGGSRCQSLRMFAQHMFQSVTARIDEWCKQQRPHVPLVSELLRVEPHADEPAKKKQRLSEDFKDWVHIHC